MRVDSTKIFVYRLKMAPPRSEWAIITLIEVTPAFNVLQVTSDFGNWSYVWAAPGGPFKQFLMSLDRGYLIDKLTMDTMGQATSQQGKKRVQERCRLFVENFWPIFKEELKAELDVITEEEKGAIRSAYAHWGGKMTDADSLFVRFAAKHISNYPELKHQVGAEKTLRYLRQAAREVAESQALGASLRGLPDGAKSGSTAGSS